MKSTTNGSHSGACLLGIVCLGLAAVSPLEGQEVKKRNSFEAHSGWVRSVAFSDDGKLLASGGTRSSGKVGDVKI